MQKDRPSLTAYRVGVSRAAHQILDAPKLLDDPIAVPIIGARGAEELRARARRFQAHFARYLRAFLIARSRVAEDALAEAVGRGVRQYVVLGAGLDTFAYRNPYPALKVFEVDHPATQEWKRAQLAAAAIPLPQSLTFVPVDFETQTLGARLREAGFADSEKAFFSWLGVSMYLRRDSVTSTLSYVATQVPCGSGVVFDYTVSPATLGFTRRMIFLALMRRVARAGEPWRTFFEPTALAAELGKLGFAHIDDLGVEELNARYFQGRSDGLRVGGFARVMSART